MVGDLPQLTLTGSARPAAEPAESGSGTSPHPHPRPPARLRGTETLNKGGFGTSSLFLVLVKCRGEQRYPGAVSLHLRSREGCPGRHHPVALGQQGGVKAAGGPGL